MTKPIILTIHYYFTDQDVSIQKSTLIKSIYAMDKHIKAGGTYNWKDAWNCPGGIFTKACCYDSEIGRTLSNFYNASLKIFGAEIHSHVKTAIQSADNIKSFLENSK